MKCRWSKNLGRVEPDILGHSRPLSPSCFSAYGLVFQLCYRVCEINPPFFSELNWFLWFTSERADQHRGLLCLLYQLPFSGYLSRGIWEFPGLEIRFFTPKACHKVIVNETIEEEPFTHGEWASSFSFLPIIQTLYFLLKGRKLVTPLYLCIYSVYTSGIQGFRYDAPLLQYITIFMSKNFYKMQVWKHP